MKKAILLGVAALCMASCGSSSKENAIQRLPSDQISVFTSSDK